MTAMLASVRNLDEALTALELGADLIDLKEPARGALGALDHAAVRVMVQVIDRRLPVSATVGDIPEMDPHEMAHAVERMAETGVDYIKIGFFAVERAFDCARALSDLARRARLVAVVFADEPWLFSPSPEGKRSGGRDGATSSGDSSSLSGRGTSIFDLIHILAVSGFAGAMLDTVRKTGKTLRDWRNEAELGDYVRQARRYGLLTGLAGSLRKEDIMPLLAVGPDYFGFRGALCRAADRVQVLDPHAFGEIRASLPKASALPPEVVTATP